MTRRGGPAAKSKARAPHDALRRMVLVGQRMAKRAAGSRLASIRWLPPQVALHRCSAPVKLLRTGNQVYGKTTAALGELIWRCEGNHPYLDVPKPPIECWVICASWSQSLAIQEKLWALVSPEEIVAGQKWDAKTGFGQHAPVLLFKNGSRIRFKTAKQDALDFAGATVDVVMWDEPPRRRRNFEESRKRVLARGGVVIISMTPINAPVDWIREQVDAGQIVDLWFPLTAENLIPVGASRPLRRANGVVCDQSYIDEVIRQTVPYEVPVTVHGEWEIRFTERLFAQWKPTEAGGHITRALPQARVQIVLGIDHGKGTGRQCAILCYVLEMPGDRYPKVWVVDEAVSPGDTTTEQDADAVLAMLDRHGWAWSDVDMVFGDNPTAPAGHAARKGNLDLEDEIARRLKLRSRDVLRPRIKAVKRGVGASNMLSDGVRGLHQMMIREDWFHVHPNCVRLIECLSKWDGSPSSEFKDAVDGLRYALRRWLTGRHLVSAGPELVVT